MSTPSSEVTKAVREAFLIPPNFATLSAQLEQQSEALPEPFKSIGVAFLGNLRGVLRTLGLPFQLVHSQVQSLHWQRYVLAARIRTQGIDDEVERQQKALSDARKNFQAFLEADGKTTSQNDIINALHQLTQDEESFSASKELTRQGVVLLWSAFEVFARDTFAALLNQHPSLAQRLLEHPSAKKRFAVEKLDWQVLADHGFDLSRSLGTLLAQRADLDDVQTIRDAYGALFPKATALSAALAQERLWFLFQKRNLIVHRRGIVDKHYIQKTGDPLAIGTQLQVTPVEVEGFLEMLLAAGEALTASMPK